MKKYGDEKDVFWVNLRQEPVFYVNGKPYTPRDPERQVSKWHKLKKGCNQ